MRPNSFTNTRKIRIAAFSNINYIAIAKQWYGRMDVLGYTEHSVVAMDNKTFSLLLAEGYRVEMVSPNMLSPKLNPISSLLSARVHYIYHSLLNGTDIFISDVDSIWNRYVSLHIFKDADVFHAFGTKWPPHVYKILGFTVCTGVALYRSTPRTIDLLKRMVVSCSKSKHRVDGQLILNDVYLNELRIKWNSNLTGGISPVSGLTIKIWNTTFVQRTNITCDGWIISPLAPKNNIAKANIWKVWGSCPIHKKSYGNDNDKVLFHKLTYSGTSAKSSLGYNIHILICYNLYDYIIFQ